jgi:hypothetical protein
MFFEIKTSRVGKKTMKIIRISQIGRTGRLLYHVTHTNMVSTIQAKGILPLQTSNWVRGSGKRYGNGEIFACEHPKDAIRWGAKMDWEFNTEIGSGKVSIITFRDDGNWETDVSDPVSQAGNFGKWLKKNSRVKPTDILQTQMLTSEMVKTITQ